MAKNRILFSNDFVLKNENVGINTTDPQALLDVNGTLKVSGVSTFTNISNFDNNVNIAGTVGIGTVVDIIAYDTLSNGTLSFEGSAGQLFSITNNLTLGSIFSVNDVSGIPSIDVDANGTIQLAPFGSAEYVGVGKTNPTEKLDVVGTVQVGQASTTSAGWSILRIKKSEGSGIVDFTDEGAGITTNTNPQYLVGRKFNERRDSLAIWRYVGDGNGGVGGHLTADALFQSSGNVYVSNNLGIGSTNPQAKLDVKGNVRVSGLTTTQNLYVTGVSTFSDLYVTGVSTFSDLYVNGALYDTNNSRGNLNEVLVSVGAGLGVTWKSLTAGEIAGAVQISSSSPSTLYYLIGVEDSTGITSSFYTNNDVVLTGDGRLGIGTTVPTSSLHIVGDALVTGIVTATDFNSASDAKLKTNIQQITDPLEKLTQIQGVSFNWIESNKPSMGVIADELQKVLPELVSDSDPKTVNYNGLIGLLIECVKQQQEEINSLKESLNN